MYTQPAGLLPFVVLFVFLMIATWMVYKKKRWWWLCFVSGALLAFVIRLLVRYTPFIHG